MIDYNPLVPVMYLMQGGWISLTPLPAAMSSSQILEPFFSVRIEYMDAEYLTSSRIYSENNLAQLRKHIMFPVEHPTMMKNFTKFTVDYLVPLDGLSINNLLDEDALSRIAGMIVERLWGGFLKFGHRQISLIIKGVKIVAGHHS